MQWNPRFMVTGIGSLPFPQPGPALDLIWRHMGGAPHWPQLPMRGHVEHFVYQYLTPLVRLGLLVESPGGQAYMDTASLAWTENMTRFYEAFLAAEAGDPQALEEFATPPEAAAGFYAFLADLTAKGVRGAKFLKGQISGPLSVGLNIRDPAGKPAYYDPQLRDLLVKTLAMQARWQVTKLAGFGLPVLFFVDEPVVGACGASTYITLKREDLVADLAAIAGGARQAGAITGGHSCAGIDWTVFMESGLAIISFDAWGYFSSLFPYVKELASFLVQGGILAWGLVPTDGHRVMMESVDSLHTRWREQAQTLAGKGISMDLLCRRTIITPACGAGTLTVEAAERIYYLADGLGDALGRGFTAGGEVCSSYQQANKY